MNGGELFYVMHDINFSTFMVKNIAAEIVLALEYLHKKNIIYT